MHIYRETERERERERGGGGGGFTKEEEVRSSFTRRATHSFRSSFRFVSALSLSLLIKNVKSQFKHFASKSLLLFSKYAHIRTPARPHEHTHTRSGSAKIKFKHYF